MAVDITVSTWNTEWRTPQSEAGRRIRSILDATRSDIIVVTEGVRDLLPQHGYIVDAGPDWGYSIESARRKVIVWSRHPLTLELAGEQGATRGRLAIATVAAPSGPVRVIGVCIPWKDSHVRSGRSDAQPWSEHLDFLERLEQILPAYDDGLPTVIAGDFNQRIPRGRQPVRVADRLNDVLADWTIHTAGKLPNGPHIDHIASDRRLVLKSVRDWANSDEFGRLSDHAGVVCEFGEDIVEAPIDDKTPRQVVPVDKPQVSVGRLTSEMRTEIEEVLRSSGDGLSHGATFQLREQGLSDAEIAAERGVTVATTRGFLRSLDDLLTGVLPTSKSDALRNSYVYRELLNHPRSEDLDRYVSSQLRKLKEINTAVRFDPLQTRSHQYRVGERKRQQLIGEPCPECGTIHSGQC